MIDRTAAKWWYCTWQPRPCLHGVERCCWFRAATQVRTANQPQDRQGNWRYDPDTPVPAS